MENIKIDYEIMSESDSLLITGSYEFESNNIDQSFIENALKKSISRLTKDKSLFISGIFNVFINRIKSFDAIFLGDPNGNIKPKIYKAHGNIG
jgi:hypothetical protein